MRSHHHEKVSLETSIKNIFIIKSIHNNHLQPKFGIADEE